MGTVKITELNTDNLPKNRVTPINLDLALRMSGLTFDKKTIDKIIDLVRLLEEKGDQVSIYDICKLQANWDILNKF